MHGTVRDEQNHGEGASDPRPQSKVTVIVILCVLRCLYLLFVGSADQGACQLSSKMGWSSWDRP